MPRLSLIRGARPSKLYMGNIGWPRKIVTPSLLANVRHVQKAPSGPSGGAHIVRSACGPRHAGVQVARSLDAARDRAVRGVAWGSGAVVGEPFRVEARFSTCGEVRGTRSSRWRSRARLLTLAVRSMARRRSAKGSRVPLILGAFAAGVLLLFLAGEMLAWTRSDSGRLSLWGHLHLGNRAHAVRIVGGLIQRGLDRAGVKPGAIASQAEGGNGPSLRMRVTLPPDGSPLQVNQLVTRAVEAGGATVLSGRERSE